MSAADRIEELEDALRSIEAWGDAYPRDIFLRPDLKKARELLTAGGMTLDAVAADCMRHVAEGVAKIAREALGSPDFLAAGTPAEPITDPANPHPLAVKHGLGVRQRNPSD